MLSTEARSLLTIITLLLVPMMPGMSLDRRAGTEGLIPSESSYWEYILREFLFKTISPPPPANNKLYRALLEAPFYRGPFPAGETADNGVLSRGDVYHLAKGGWIICQDGCVDCEKCAVQKTRDVPTVKWTLRRIRRRDAGPRQRAAGSRRPYDLQVTIWPQADNSFHMNSMSPVSYVYVTSNDGVVDSFTDDLIRRNKETRPYPFGIRRPQDQPKARKYPEPHLDAVTTDGEVRATSTPRPFPETQTRPRNMSSRQRGRDISQGETDRRRIDQRRVHEDANPTQDSTPTTLFQLATESTVDDDLIRGNEEALPYPFGTQRPQDQPKAREDPEPHLDAVTTDGGVRATSTPRSFPETQTRPRNIPGRKRDRDISQGERDRRRIDQRRVHEDANPTQDSTPTTLFQQATDSTVETSHADCGTEDTRLILGRDQFGEKHLVHIVPAGYLDSSLHPKSRPVDARWTILRHEERPLYRKIFRRVMDSLNTHKIAIEKFLFSPNLEEHPGRGAAPDSPAAKSMFPTKDRRASSNSHESSNTTRNAGEKQPGKHSRSASSDNSEEVIRRDGELASSTSATTITENYEVTAGTGHNEKKLGLNIGPGDFDKENSSEKKTSGPGSTLILKEVAKSVVDHPADTLQGFNSATNITTLEPGSLLTQALEVGTTPGSTEYSLSDRREKSQRHA